LDISGLHKNLISITQFNKGKASPLFARAQKGEAFLVIKNNLPVAVVISPEEYDILRGFSKVFNKALETSYEECYDEIVLLSQKLKTYDMNGDQNV